MSLRKAVRDNKDLREFMVDRFPGVLQAKDPQLGADKFTQFRDELAKHYEKINYQPQEILNNSSLNELFDMKPENDLFIRLISCAGSRNLDCHNLTRVSSLQDRLCTTLFYRGSLIYDSRNRPELFDIPDLVSDDFDSKEIVRIVLDFDPDNYADLKRQIGARLIFHDANHIASTNMLDYYVNRGSRYEFNVRREDTILNGLPYWDCMDYESLFAKEFLGQINPRVPLAMESCFQNCVVRNVLLKEGCWPATMPYFRNETLAQDQTLKPCTAFGEVARMAQFKETVRVETYIRETSGPEFNMSELLSGPRSKVRAQQRSYMRIQRYCLSECTLSCRKPSFIINLSRSTWPTDSEVILDQTDQKLRLRHCCALITVKFVSSHYTVQQYVPKYNLIDTIGNIGGILAVWLGLSIVSIYRVLHKCLEFCYKHSSYDSRVRDIRQTSSMSIEFK